MGISRIDAYNELKEGDSIKIVDGPFVGMVGKIESVDLEGEEINEYFSSLNEKQKQITANALVHGAHGHPCDCAAIDVHYFVDNAGLMVAFPYLGLYCRNMGHRCLVILFQAHRLYLPRMSQCFLSPLEGGFLGLPYAQSASTDLLFMRKPRSLH